MPFSGGLPSFKFLGLLWKKIDEMRQSSQSSTSAEQGLCTACLKGCESLNC